MKTRTHGQLSTRFRSIYDAIESSSKYIQWLILALYIISLCVVSYFHEPWFDEAQSWLIARDANFWDILFNIPHYEGHPPLWHLYLALFAKTGFSYEFGLKLAAVLLNALAMGVMILKAPFPKIVRFIIPFTYFFFYQYGVISRCYSLMMLGFVISALFWETRNSRPFRFVMALMLVCASSAYGIVLCAGIAAVWLLEIMEQRPFAMFVRSFIRDKRFFSLLLLLSFAVSITLLLLPRSDTYAANLAYDNTIFMRLFYMFILAPIDALFYTSVPISIYLPKLGFNNILMIPGIFVFLIFITAIYFVGRRRGRLMLLIIPYAFFALFSAYTYFYIHHLGIIALFFLFWAWACYSDVPHSNTPSVFVEKVFVQLSGKYRFAVGFLIAAIIAVPLIWNVSASITDIRYDYYSGRKVAAFIRDNELEDCRIMVEWYISEDEESDIVNINHQISPAINAYFDHNIFYNLNNGNERLTYVTHIVPTHAETTRAYALWRSYGAPDVLIGDPALEAVFGDRVSYAMYTQVADIPNGMFFKHYVFRESPFYTGTEIYIRTDLLDQYGLEPYASESIEVVD